jgi:hypothetical protein
MHTIAVDTVANAGGTSQKIAISAVSAQSAVMTGSTAVVTPDVNCFYRADINPTALSNGTDQILVANKPYRISGVLGLKLAFIAGGAGNVYITTEA